MIRVRAVGSLFCAAMVGNTIGTEIETKDLPTDHKEAVVSAPLTRSSGATGNEALHQDGPAPFATNAQKQAVQG